MSGLAGKYAVVTTEFRGVFFGKLPEDYSEGQRTITLTEPQMCVYWTKSVRGVLGLAAQGPNAECRVSKAPPLMEIRKVTGVIEVSDEGVEAWKSFPWS